MALVLRYAIRSHVGLIREGNEDSGYAGPRLLAIADGMGGAAAGELASAVVMATVSRLDAAPGDQPGGDTLSSTGESPMLSPGGQPMPGVPVNGPNGPGPNPPNGPGGQGQGQAVPATEQTLDISAHDIAAHEPGLRAASDPALGEPDLALLGGAVVAANERLRAIVAERPELEGMGTTLTAMLWSGGRFGMVHVGDSRAYRLRDGLLEQMTADHTWVQRLIDEGRITEEEAGHHPQRSLLMRVLDGRTQVEADIGTFDAHAGDRYLLCSDGLSGFVSQETLAETLAAYQDPQQAVDALIELALRAGGPDNITCIVADTIDDGTIPGASPNEATQLLGSLTPVVVGAASEGVERLPRFQTPGGSGGQGQAPQDDFPQNHPAGRAARLRPRRNQQNQQQQHQQAVGAPEQHPGAPLATAPPHYDPSAQTTEMDSVPGQRVDESARSHAFGNGAGPDGFQPSVPGPPGGPGSKRSKKGLIIGGAVVVVLAGAAVGTYLYSQGQYYVKPSSDGKQVQLYQGTSQLSFLTSQVSLADSGGPLWLVSVPKDRRADLNKTVNFSSKSAALAYIEEYRKAAQTCADFRRSQAAAQSQQSQTQNQNQGAPQPPLPTQSSESKGGAPIGADPGATPPPNSGTQGVLPSVGTTGAPTTSAGDTGSAAPQSPNPPSTSASAPPVAGNPQLQAYCAGTTDGPQ